ncbi:histone acetylation protein-domain-containing protein [Cantharellus anzutake]|uniref:histone acetylation protein-domain-containing protein n=1 Tax=Cantharellus anzutake TaxID=1750568 RepID=UPI0019082788|nr:histone acetylation protein-domain-containing protein [Cantharellus anzutake]KAF8340353.1 histone acetylation protein-domain-containing protein [Cantharellus anzutake]
MGTLRDALVDGLKGLPGRRDLHIYTLVSNAMRDQELYFYSNNRPKAHVRHILVLLAQQSIDGPDTHRVFVCAIEAFLYSLPSTSSAILYVSKVDSTGQGTVRPNPTSALVQSFLSYYASPATRPAPNLWVQLFARSQNQYIFPNSAEHSGKHVLRDIKLCKWWKDVIERVAQKNDPNWVRLYYLLPGMSSLEALSSLHKSPLGASTSYPWTYSHPYHQTDVVPPCGASWMEIDSPPSIAELIPSFNDDPKARFLDEIACTHSESTEAVVIPKGFPSLRPSKRLKTIEGQQKEDKANSGSSKNSANPVSPASQKALAAVPLDEFWERMAFRQECSQGAVTGFFTAIFYTEQSCRTPSSISHYEPALPPSPPGEVSLVVLGRILGTLSNLDFGSTDRAVRATNVLEDAIRGLLDAEKTSPPQTGPDTQLSASQSPQASSIFDEMAETPTTTAKETLFEKYIYAKIVLDNPPARGQPEAGPQGQPKESQPPVTVLQVRKKKRAAGTA